MTKDAVTSALEQAGSFIPGHYVLSSGRHAERYLEKFNLFQWPSLTEIVCSSIAESVRHVEAEVVVGPPMGGVILAYEVARQLGVRAVIVEPGEPSGELALRRHYKLKSGERVLVVDDILTTGRSVREALRAVRLAGGEPVAVAVMVDRSGGSSGLDLPLFGSVALEQESFLPEDCPACRRGDPVTERGLRE